MSISLASIQKGITANPPVITIHSDEGLGKSTFAANAPAPIFIPTENSLGNLDVPRFPLSSSYEDVMERITVLLQENHSYKCAIFDTLDWFEPMVWNYTMRQNPTTEKGLAVKNIEGYGYGKGYKLALEYWSDFISYTDRLRFEKDMMVIYIVHSSVRKVTPPDMDSYDCYMPKLQDADKTSAKDKIMEHSDIVLFANWRTALTDEKLGFGASRNRAVGSGERVVYTEARPAYSAKNRYSLPPQIQVKDPNWQDVWSVLAGHIPWFKQFQSAPAPTPIPTPIPAGEAMPKFLTKEK
jgi:hypothetical protein